MSNPIRMVQPRFDNGAFGIAAGAAPSVTGHDARVALEIALAAAESVRTGAPVALTEAVTA